MTININPIAPDDVYQIISLQARIWPKASSFISKAQMDYMFGKIYNPEALKEEMAKGQNYLILYADGLPQGFVSHSVGENDPSVYKLNKIFVLPESHGKGFGQMLLDNIVDIARAKNAGFLDLYVNQNNPACAFYKKNGFEIIEKKDIPFGPYTLNDYLMRKPI